MLCKHCDVTPGSGSSIFPLCIVKPGSNRPGSPPLPHEGRVFFLCGVRWALVQRCCSHLRFAGRTGEKRTETAPALYETLSIILLLAIGLLRPECF